MDIRVSVNTLRQLRLAYGLDQKKAAVRAGISEGYWHELETGKRDGSPKKIRLIAAAFGLGYYDIVRMIERSREVAERHRRRPGNNASRRTVR
jgi:transcriptional regulator with XRE-family HTH domain